MLSDSLCLADCRGTNTNPQNIPGKITLADWGCVLWRAENFANKIIFTSQRTLLQHVLYLPQDQNQNKTLCCFCYFVTSTKNMKNFPSKVEVVIRGGNGFQEMLNASMRQWWYCPISQYGYLSLASNASRSNHHAVTTTQSCNDLLYPANRHSTQMLWSNNTEFRDIKYYCLFL